MSAHATPRPRALLSLSLLVALTGLSAIRAHAQVDPRWDHYKLYHLTTADGGLQPFYGGSVVLVDQFTTSTHIANYMWHFMNPTEKRVGTLTFPINDPRTHYAWWDITPQPFSATVAAINQFGDQMLSIQEAIFLLNPALKNEQGPLPPTNHYKCYRCTGQPVNVPVFLTDQFGPWEATVLQPQYFCNPVEKTVGTITHPIVDPNQHYTCYVFSPADTRFFTPFVQDQFVTHADIRMGNSDVLCVPTYKASVTATGNQTWGRLKLLYR